MDNCRTGVFRFAEFEVNLALCCLKHLGNEQKLRPQAFQLLCYLMEHRRRVVTKDELLDRIWPDAAVTDDALVQCVVEVRRALADDPRHPRFIKTIPKQGYRFVGPVEELPDDAGTVLVETEEVTTIEVHYEEEHDDVGAGVSPIPRRSRQRWIAAALSAGLALVLTAALYVSTRPHLGTLSDIESTFLQTPGKQTVLVMPFENGSRSEDLDWLREGLVDMLVTDLSRSEKLTVLSRHQLHILLERMNAGPTSRTSLDTALKMASSGGADIIVLGSFVRLGAKIRVDAQLHAAGDGRLLVGESLVADQPDQLLTQVSLLSLKMAAHLNAAPKDRSRRLGDVMTRSLEAYRYYSLAVEKAQAYHTKESIDFLQRAIALDPEFAMAHARIGYAYAVIWNNEREKARPYLERAFQLAHRLTERDRLYITAWYAIAHEDNRRAIEMFRQLTARYPHEIEAYTRLGYLLRGQARYEEAVEVLQQALSFDAEAKSVYNALGFLYWQLGRYRDAVAAHQRYVDLAPDEANAYDSLGMSFLEAERYKEAVKAFEQALRLQGNFHFARLHLGDVHLSLGRYREAARQYEAYLEMAPSDWDCAQGYHRLALLYLRKGDIAKARGAAQEELNHDNDLGGPLLVALAEGDLAAAQEALQRVVTASAYTEEETENVNDRLLYFRGLYALHNGQPDEAVEFFRKSVEEPVILWNVNGIEECLASAYMELGRLEEAIAEYRRLLRTHPAWPPAVYALGLAYSRRGDSAQARVFLKHFLELWKDADPDAPEVIAAKAAANRL